jgi:hypothetical protein
MGRFNDTHPANWSSRTALGDHNIIQGAGGD